MAALTTRFRHWGASDRANAAEGMLERDDTAPN